MSSVEDMLKPAPIIEAAQNVSVSALRKLLNEGADASVRDSEGRTALHHAVMRGNLAAVDLLIAANGGKQDLLLQADVLGCSPVHLAAVQNQVTLILRLVEALQKDDGGRTPLHLLAQQRCMQDFMGFLHLGWEVASRADGDGSVVGNQSAAWAAVAGKVDLGRPGLGIVRQTMQWGPLHMAAIAGDAALIRVLIRNHKCDASARAANSWTPLHYAAAYNKVAAIEALVDLGCCVSIKDSVNSTPVHVAAGEGHREAISALHRLGASVRGRDRDGCTPLYCAAAWDRIAAVRQLANLGCPPQMQSEEGRTAVHVAAEQGWDNLLQVLVSELGSPVDLPDWHNFTPLHAAANSGHSSAIRVLLRLGHPVDPRDNLGRTPLHYAALHGRVAAISALAAAGAGLAAADSRGGLTPLHLAADGGQCAAAAALHSLGASLEAVTSKGWTPLVLATSKGPANVDTIGLLLDLGANTSAIADAASLETPLHIAARSGRTDVVNKLLARHVAIQARTKDGSTALHYAAAFGHAAVVEALVRAGCPVDVRDHASNTPLHLAAGCGFKDAIETLTALGADLNAKDVTCCTPLQNAAHGTYSALQAPTSSDAAPPAAHGSKRHTGSSAANGGSSGSSATMTPSQLAAQAAVAGPGARPDGLLPVRTGLAWATIGQNNMLANLCSLAGPPLAEAAAAAAAAVAASALPPLGAKGAPLGAAASAGAGIAPGQVGDWRSLGLMHLLKHASKRCPAALPALSFDGSALEGWKDKDLEVGVEALLRKTEALQLSSLEQDRARLLPVARRLVELGAHLEASDSEGRTALHLAAGCGDKAMALLLVELGADVNCRDSVGGTPMHHAAMANKREMMLTLARLGCDYRAHADGIDGATATFVLCGQHGKTSQQQTGLNLMLKKCFKEGAAARAEGRSPVTAGSGVVGGGGEPDAAASEAAMLSLLEEEALLERKACRRRKKRRSKTTSEVAELLDASADCQTSSVTHETSSVSRSLACTNGHSSYVTSVRQSDNHQSHTNSHEHAGKEFSGLLHHMSQMSDRQALPGQSQAAHSNHSHGDVPSQQSYQKGESAVINPPAGGSSDLPGQNGIAAIANSNLKLEAPHSHSDSTAAMDEKCSLDHASADAVRATLELEVKKATTLLDIGAAAGEDVILASLGSLDAAIAQATSRAVSAKYAKKVRRRLAALSQTFEAASPQPNDGVQGSWRSKAAAAALGMPRTSAASPHIDAKPRAQTDNGGHGSFVSTAAAPSSVQAPDADSSSSSPGALQPQQVDDVGIECVHHSGSELPPAVKLDLERTSIAATPHSPLPPPTQSGGPLVPEPPSSPNTSRRQRNWVRKNPLLAQEHQAGGQQHTQGLGRPEDSNRKPKQWDCHATQQAAKAAWQHAGLSDQQQQALPEVLQSRSFPPLGTTPSPAQAKSKTQSSPQKQQQQQQQQQQSPKDAPPPLPPPSNAQSVKQDFGQRHEARGPSQVAKQPHTFADGVVATLAAASGDGSRRSSGSFSNDPVVMSPMSRHHSDTCPVWQPVGPHSLLGDVASGSKPQPSVMATTATVSPATPTAPAAPSAAKDATLQQPQAVQGRIDSGTRSVSPRPNGSRGSALGSLSMAAFAQQQVQHAQHATQLPDPAAHLLLPAARVRRPPPGFPTPTQSCRPSGQRRVLPPSMLRAPLGSDNNAVPSSQRSSLDSQPLEPLLPHSLLPPLEDPGEGDAETEAHEHISQGIVSSLFDDESPEQSVPTSATQHGDSANQGGVDQQYGSPTAERQHQHPQQASSRHRLKSQLPPLQGDLQAQQPWQTITSQQALQRQHARDQTGTIHQGRFSVGADVSGFADSGLQSEREHTKSLPGLPLGAFDTPVRSSMFSIPLSVVDSRATLWQ